VFATVNGVRLFFDVLNPQLEIVEAGLNQKPVLLCLHGGPGGDHQTMRPSFDRLASVAQVVYLDQRGGGRSEHGPAEAWTLDQWADDVAAFCDALGIRPIVLGQSGGSIVTQAFLARHPERAAGAVLLNACARMDREALIAGWEALGPEAGAAARAMYTRGAPEDAPGFFQHCMPFYSHRGAPIMDAGAAARVRFNFQLSQRFFQTDGEAWRFDHRRALGKVACPVLVLVGAHDPVTRPEWGREVFEALPAGLAELQVFPDSSHAIQADEPEALFAAIERFVGRISAG
jgi:pimeloyl-ACP methyl ester carboxylesterase